MAISILLLGRMTGYAQSHEKSFLKRYDLSTTVINPDTAPTDEIYSWWTETAKKEWIAYGNEPMDDRWLHRPEPLGFRGENFLRAIRRNTTAATRRADVAASMIVSCPISMLKATPLFCT